MITTSNEFETIPAFTHVAGQADGSSSARETATDLLKAYDAISSVSRGSLALWREIATSDDDSEELIEIQQEIADMITDHGTLPDFCYVTLHDGEWLVLPDVDEAQADLEVFDEIPDELIINSDHEKLYAIMVVNDHGNATFMEWQPVFAEYREVWAVV